MDVPLLAHVLVKIDSTTIAKIIKNLNSFFLARTNYIKKFLQFICNYIIRL